MAKVALALLVFVGSLVLLVHIASPQQQQLRTGAGDARVGRTRVAQQQQQQRQPASGPQLQPQRQAGRPRQSALSQSPQSPPQAQSQPQLPERLSLPQLCAARLCTCRAPSGLYVCQASPRLRLRRVPSDIPVTAQRLYVMPVLQLICCSTRVNRCIDQ